jgi:hypothetical protein
MIDFSEYKFRCSSLGALLTEPRSKAEGILSETCKAELIKIYIKEVYGREKDITNKYVEKGLAVEEDSITLLSRVKQMYLQKNEIRYTNDYITGEPDIVKPLYDTKSCWDIHTFFAAKSKPLKRDYEYQLQGYMDLIGTNVGTVAFCLIDTPLGLIEDEKRRLLYKMNVVSDQSPEYLEACEKLEKEMTFRDIPLEQRIHEVVVLRDETLITRIYGHLQQCRQWLNYFAKKNQPRLITTL